MDQLARLRNVVLLLLMLAGNTLPAKAEAEAETKGLPKLKKFTFRQPCMGTLFNLTLFAEDQLTANRAAKAGFDRLIALDAALSDYKEDSELNKLSASSGTGSALATSKDLRKVLEYSAKLSSETNGAFDITIGPLVQLWRAARKTHSLPDIRMIRESRKKVGSHLIRLDDSNNTVELLAASMRLDLGGVAKGYATDAMAATIREKFGLTQLLIDGGGDVLAGDPPPGRKAWNVAVRNPNDSERPWIVSLANASLATSGDLHQFVEIEGVRYSHIVNPATGMGLTHRLQVSIVAPTGMEADALASAVSVLGPEAGFAFAKAQENCEALIVQDGASPVETRVTENFPLQEGLVRTKQ